MTASASPHRCERGHAGRVDEVGRDRVAGKRVAVDEKHAVAARARSIAVGDPATRAPTTMASYSVMVGHLFAAGVSRPASDGPRRGASVSSPISRLSPAAAHAPRRRPPRRDRSSPTLSSTFATWCSTVLRVMNSRSPDLRVGQPLPKERQHLHLALRQQTDAARLLRAGRDPSDRSRAAAASASAASLDPLEGGECQLCLGDGRLAIGVGQGACASRSRVRPTSIGIRPRRTRAWPGRGARPPRHSAGRQPGATDRALAAGANHIVLRARLRCASAIRRLVASARRPISPPPPPAAPGVRTASRQPRRLPQSAPKHRAPPDRLPSCQPERPLASATGGWSS